MDLLSAMRSFVRVAETGSFSAVSRETGVSQPTVSRQIAELERHFGARVLSRTTRSLSLTEDGRSLLSYARDMIDALEAAEAALGRTRLAPAGLVRIGTTTALGLHLTTIIGSLLERWPALSVEVVMRDSFGDIVEEGLDLAVRAGEIGDSTLITRKLVDIGRVLVASPSYLTGRALPLHPHDLAEHPCIAYTYGSAKREWPFLPVDGRSIEDEIVVPATGRFHANNSECVHRAAIEGLGVAALPAFQVRADITAGLLVRLMQDWRLPDLTLHLVYPGPRNLPLRTRTALEFLISIGPTLAH
jgi:DNA-binding transcriptional LysR family regulator